jgi:hypothetical protein
VRAARIILPSLIALLIAGVLVAVLTSSGGSKARACRGGKEHCRHDATQVAGSPAEQGADGAPEGSSGATGSHGPHDKSGGRGASGSAAPGGAGPGSGGGSNGGTPAGGANGSGNPAAGAGGGAATAGTGTPTVTLVASKPPVVTPEGKLAPGSSDRGTWATSGPPHINEVEPAVTAASISFVPPLRLGVHEDKVVYVSQAETAKPGASRSAAVKAACGEGGTLAAPTANPGYLCVYANEEDFRDRDSSGGVPLHTVHGAKVPFVDGEFFGIMNHYSSPGADRYGARIAFGVPYIRTEEEEAVGAFAHIVASGSWVVTAPPLAAH